MYLCVIMRYFMLRNLCSSKPILLKSSERHLTKLFSYRDLISAREGYTQLTIEDESYINSYV